MEAFNAYSGLAATIKADGDLKSVHAVIEAQLGVPTRNQLVLVAPKGSVLKEDMLRHSPVLHVYDKQLMAEGARVVTNAPAKPPSPSTTWYLDAISETKQRIARVGESTALCYAHLKLHFASFEKNWAKRAASYGQVRRDLDSCRDWQQQWRKLAFMDLSVLDYDATLRSWDAAQQLAAKLEAQFRASPRLELTEPAPHAGVDFDEKMVRRDLETLSARLEGGSTSTGPSSSASLQREIVAELGEIGREAEAAYAQALSVLSAAQARLVETIKKVAQLQARLAQQRQVLSGYASETRELDALKTEVAKVVDFAFVYGIALAEKSRRRAWCLAMEQQADTALERFEALRQREIERMAEWSGRYGKLDLIEKLIKTQESLPTVRVDFSAETLAEDDDVWAYMDNLKAAGLAEVAAELAAEMHSISHELDASFARAPRPDMYASVSMGRRRSSAAKDDTERAHLRQMLRLKDAEIEAANQRIKELEGLLEARPEPLVQGPLISELTVSPEAASLLPESQVPSQAPSQAPSEPISPRSPRSGSPSAPPPGSPGPLSPAGSPSLSPVGSLSPSRSSHSTSDLSSVPPAPATPLLSLMDKTSDLAQRLFANSHNLEQVLESMGLQTQRKVVDGRLSYQVNRVRGLRRSSRSGSGSGAESSSVLLAEQRAPEPRAPRPSMLNWVRNDDDEEFELFIHEIYIDYDIFRQAVTDRFGEVERIARKYHSQSKGDREKIRQLEKTARNRLALNQFKVGDLILFLPTRESDRTPNPWAAFNVNSPHYFLDPASMTQLSGREFVIGRATKISQFQVGAHEANPFGLPDGLQWYMISATWR